MAGDLRQFALEKAELLSGRLKELLSTGEGYVRAQLGLDLSLKAEQYPPWAILVTAAAGLLMLAVSCTAVCGGLLGGKKRQSLATTSQRSTEPDKASVIKSTAKPEDLRRKNKKKLSEKSSSNGQPVSISQEIQENEKISPNIKAEKAFDTQTISLKKNKKRPKTDMKPTQQVSTAEGKEQDEGAWETKVSNREKRQQRKKERGPDDPGSPGGVEAPKASAEALGPKINKRNKNHDHQLSKSSGKNDSTTIASGSSWNEEALKSSAGWTDMSLKMSAQMGSGDGPKWSGISATQPWAQEAQAWSGIEGRMKTELNSVSFTMLGLNTAEPSGNSIEQWTNQADLEDEWSGFNGMIAVDPSSDWNAPVDYWGNYEEPPTAEAAAFTQKEKAATKLSEDEKDGDDPSDSAKSKKRRRKKKKTEEETSSQTVSSVPKHHELPGQVSQKPCISSAQKKPEETADPLKHTQKKKVRRDT